MSASAAYRLDSLHRGVQGFAQYASEKEEQEDPIYIYDRLQEPTRALLEDNLAFAEDGEMAVCFAFKQGITDNTRVVYLETPVNPTLHLIDIAALRSILDNVNLSRRADKKIQMIVDNTFATPFCQRPLALGADLVVHSLTKNIGHRYGRRGGWIS